MKRVAVLGAGLSGLVCAQTLQNEAEVRVFEKSRGDATLPRLSIRSRRAVF